MGDKQKKVVFVSTEAIHRRIGCHDRPVKAEKSLSYKLLDCYCHCRIGPEIQRRYNLPYLLVRALK